MISIMIAISKFKYLILVPFILFISCSVGAPIDEYSAEVWKSPNGGSINYRYRLPYKVEEGKKYPMLFFLHGAGGRGVDNKGQLLDANSIDAFKSQKLLSKFNSYVFAGQVPEGEQWVNVDWTSNDHQMPKISNSMQKTLEALDAFIIDSNNQVDVNRIYIMGLSMGGYGTWDAVQRRPNFFAAAVPICGGGDKSMAKSLINVPIWSWHGNKDQVINVLRSREMNSAIKRSGGSPKYTEVKGRGHDVWLDVWSSDDLWEWLYSQSK